MGISLWITTSAVDKYIEIHNLGQVIGCLSDGYIQKFVWLSTGSLKTICDYP